MSIFAIWLERSFYALSSALFAGMIRQVACLNRQLYYHPDGEINDDILEKVYGCPVELVAHGVPHRVLSEH